MNFKQALFRLTLCTFALPAVAQAPRLHNGATIYIEPMDGFETYLAAAFIKKHVPVLVVLDRNKAEYVIASAVVHKDLSGGQPAVVINNNTSSASDNSPGASMQSAMQQGYAAGRAEKLALGETSVSISVIDTHSSQIVFAYAAGKMGKNQIQSSAEACAKHLEEFIEKSAKPKK